MSLKLKNIKSPKLLSNWDFAKEQEEDNLTASIVRFLEKYTTVPTEYRSRARTTEEMYGLPYTSCSGYGALWVTNSPCYYQGMKVDGVAILESTQQFVLICTDENENTKYYI